MKDQPTSPVAQPTGPQRPVWRYSHTEPFTQLAVWLNSQTGRYAYFNPWRNPNEQKDSQP